MAMDLRDTPAIFERYEAIRARLPAMGPQGKARHIRALPEIAGEVDAFVFDAFGVLNLGEVAIPGAVARVAELRAAGLAVRVLTNAASYDRAGAVAKFRRLGFSFEDHEIVTSREAAIAALDARLWGIIAAPGDTVPEVTGPRIMLGEDAHGYDEAQGVLFLSTAAWRPARQAVLEASLLEAPRPLIIANADLVAPRGDGFSLEPGYYGHLLADRTAAGVAFYGKPFAQVFGRVEATLPGIPRHRIALCGDTLHTDVLGAAAAGWRSVLVTRDGLFAGSDVGSYIDRSGLAPDWITPRI